MAPYYSNSGTRLQEARYIGQKACLDVVVRVRSVLELDVHRFTRPSSPVVAWDDLRHVESEGRRGFAANKVVLAGRRNSSNGR